MILLRLNLVPKGIKDIAKRKKLGLWFSTVVLLYHGQNFSLEETGIVHSDSQVTELRDKTELISLIPTPVSGNYLVKIQASLIEAGEEIGFKTKRFISLRVE